MINGEPGFEMLCEIDRWRFIALIMLELQIKKPIPFDVDYLKRKGFDNKRRAISLTIQMLQEFIEVVTEDNSPCNLYNKEEEEYKEDEEEDSENIFYVTQSLKTILPQNINSEILKNCLRDFSKQRTKMKAPLTDRALELLIIKLNDLSNGDINMAIAILDESIMNSWKGVFPLKGKSKSSFESNIEQTIKKYGHKDE